MELKLPKGLIKMTSNIKFSPYPMWVQYKPQLHLVKGIQVRQILDFIRTGDILLRRYNAYLNSLFMSVWGHAGLYVGNNQVIHALGKGVVKEDILNFCRTDSICIRRIKAEDPLVVVNRAITFAEDCIGKKYDFNFKIGDNKYSCSELINACYKPLFINDYEQVRIWPFKPKTVITPAGLYRSEAAQTILEFKN